MVRHNALKGIRSDVSPIHWQNGAIARLKKGETIDKLLEALKIYIIALLRLEEIDF